ncbi:unnamed protein product [Ilex paraguariensis]|uniref:Uncharacterized protein n=1 Tax=Ilex paraguariensis TaxID=185542 RepID=A0ABC8V6N8_9AQUA
MLKNSGYGGLDVVTFGAAVGVAADSSTTLYSSVCSRYAHGGSRILVTYAGGNAKGRGCSFCMK